MSKIDIRNAPSGFRAFAREAAMQLHVFNRYTCTLETNILAGRLGIPIISVPIEVNDPTRETRLFRSIGQYVRRSVQTVQRITTLYSPLRTHSILAAVPASSVSPGFFITYEVISCLGVDAAVRSGGFVVENGYETFGGNFTIWLLQPGPAALLGARRSPGRVLDLSGSDFASAQLNRANNLARARSSAAIPGSMILYEPPEMFGEAIGDPGRLMALSCPRGRWQIRPRTGRSRRCGRRPDRHARHACRGAGLPAGRFAPLAPGAAPDPGGLVETTCA